MFQPRHNRMAVQNAGSPIYVSDDNGATWVPLDEAPELPRCPTCGQHTGEPPKAVDPMRVI